MKNMSNQLLFSVVTICYNSAQTIERTIKSVLAQTYTNFEYIIVDGGSTDSTLDIVKKYEPLFKGRLKWKSEPDHGIYDAMNKGILCAKGIIVGIVNSDDWLEADALANVEHAFKKNNCDEETIYCGNLIFHYLDGSKLKRVASRKRLKRSARTYDIGVFHPATFVPKQIYMKLGIFDLQFKLNADVDFILRCYQNAVKFSFINAVLSNMSDGGATNSGNTSKEIADRKLVIKKHAKNKFDFYRVWYLYLFKMRIKKILSPSIARKIRNMLDK